MAKYLRLPSGVEAKFDDTVTYEQAIAMVRAKDPTLLLTPEERAEKSGFTAALGSGLGGFWGQTKAGIGEMINSPELVRSGQRDVVESREGFLPTTSEERRRALEEGVAPGLSAAWQQYVSEPVGGILGRYGIPMLGMAATTLAAPEVGLPLWGARAATAGVGMTSDFPAEVGENIERQREVSPGEAVNMQTALGTGFLQAGMVAVGIPGWGVLTKEAQVLMGTEASMLAKQVADGKMTKAAAQARINGTLRNVVEQSIIATGTGAGLMVGTEALRRGQAGQEVLSPEAMGVYGEQLVGAAELGPLFGLTHGLGMRGRQMKYMEAADKQAKAKEDAASRGSMGPQGELFGSTGAGELPPTATRYTPDGRPVQFTQATRAEENLRAAEDLYASRGARARQGFDTGDLGMAARAGADRDLLGQQIDRMRAESPQEQRASLERTKAQLPALQKLRKDIGQQIAEATARGDEVAVQQLIARHKQVGEAVQSIDAQARAAGIFTPGEIKSSSLKLERRFHDLSAKIDSHTEKGAYDKLGPLVAERDQVALQYEELAKLRKTQTEGQMDMFGFNAEARSTAEAAWRKKAAQETDKLTKEIGPELFEKLKQQQPPSLHPVEEVKRIRQAWEDYKATRDAAAQERQQKLDDLKQTREGMYTSDAPDIKVIADRKVLGYIENQIEQGLYGGAFKDKATLERVSVELDTGVLHRDSRRYLGLGDMPNVDIKTREGAATALVAINKRLSDIEERMRGLYGQKLGVPGKEFGAPEERLNKAGKQLILLGKQRNELLKIRDSARETLRADSLASRLVYKLTGERTVPSMQERQAYLAELQAKKGQQELDAREDALLEEQRDAVVEIAYSTYARVKEANPEVAEAALHNLVTKDPIFAKASNKLRDAEARVARERAERAKSKIGEGEKVTPQAVGKALEALETSFNTFREDIKRLHNREFIGVRAEGEKRSMGTGTKETITRSASETSQDVVDAAVARVEAFRKDRGLSALTADEKRAIEYRIRDVLTKVIERASRGHKIKKFDAMMGKTVGRTDSAGNVSFTEHAGAVQRKLSEIQSEYMQAGPTAPAPVPRKALPVHERVKRQYEVLLTKKADAVLNSPTRDKLSGTRIADLEAYRAKTAKFESTEAIRTEMGKLIERIDRGRPELEAPSTTRASASNWRRYHEGRIKQAEALEEKRRAKAHDTALGKVIEHKQEYEIPGEPGAPATMRSMSVLESPAYRKAEAAADKLVAATGHYDKIAAALAKAQAEGKTPKYIKGLTTRWEKAYVAAMNARDEWYTAKREAKDAIDDALTAVKNEMGVAENKAQREAALARQSKLSVFNERAKEVDRVAEDLAKEAKAAEGRVAEQQRLETAKSGTRTTRTTIPVEVKDWKSTEAGKAVVKKHPRASMARVDALREAAKKAGGLDAVVLGRGAAHTEVALLRDRIAGLKEGTRDYTDVRNRLKQLSSYLADSKEYATARKSFSKTSRNIPETPANVRRQLGYITTEDIVQHESGAAKLLLRKLADARKQAAAAANDVAKFVLRPPGQTRRAKTDSDPLVKAAQRRVEDTEATVIALAKEHEALAVRAYNERITKLDEAVRAVKAAEEAAEAAGLSGRVPEGRLAVELAERVKELEESTNPFNIEMRDETIRALKGISYADRSLAKFSDKKQAHRTRTTRAEREARSHTEESVAEYARTTAAGESGLESTSIAESGISFRRHEGEPPAKGMVESEARGIVNRANTKLPGALKIELLDSVEQAPAGVRATMAAQGLTRAKGAIMPDGRIVVFAKEHASRRDLEETIAHESIGHYGVDGVLGEVGMKALATRAFAKGENAFLELATALGMRNEILGIGGATRHLPEAERQMLMLRELLAHTAETRPLERSMVTRVKDFIKDMVAAVRSWFRSSGMNEMASLSTGEIHKIIRDAHRAFEKNQLGATVDRGGKVHFRSASSIKPEFASSNAELVGFADALVGNKKSLKDRIFSNAIGLAGNIQFVDRFAGLERVAKGMKDALGGVQMMYFLRAYDTRQNVVAETALRGARRVVASTRPDGRTEYTYGARGTASLADVSKALAPAKEEIGNANAVTSMFTAYMAAERAQNVGKDKLGVGTSDAQLASALAFGRNNPHFQKARKLYEEYNHGMLDFLEETGALSAESVAKLKSIKDYIGYYREKDGYVVDSETNIRIGDLKNQPFLKELLGGDKPILDFATSALQNTSLLTDLALRNLATKNVAFTLQGLGMLAGRVRKGDGPAAADVIRFKVKGVDHHARISTEGTALEGIPPELLVKGMEGVSTSLPGILRIMQGPSSLLRKGITRSPAYAIRQAIRDPWHAAIAGGVDGIPVLNAMKELGSMLRNNSAVEKALQEQGLLISQVFGSGEKADQAIIRDFVAGSTHWTAALAKLDHLAIKGDASARVAAYNSFVKQGMSHMEASLAQLDMMNFTKKGVSPSMNALSMMIPFFNAQIVGLSTLAKSMRGTTLFADRVKVQNKLIKRGTMMAGLTLMYTALVSDSDAYKSAKPLERLMNIFVPLPGSNEMLRVPIPFEVGYLFKALPEAVLNTASGDEKLKDMLPAIRHMLINTLPGGSNYLLPQGIKPVIGALTGHDPFTGEDIVQGRAATLEAPYQAYKSTTELSKAVGKTIGVSPIKLDYLIRGYTGTIGAAIASLSNIPTMGGKPTWALSDTPVIGSMVQPEEGGRWVDAAYRRVSEATKAQATYKNLVSEGKVEEAAAFAKKRSAELAALSMAGQARAQLGDIASSMRAVYTSDLPPAEKRQRIDALKRARAEYAKSYVSASL